MGSIFISFPKVSFIKNIFHLSLSLMQTFSPKISKQTIVSETEFLEFLFFFLVNYFRHMYIHSEDPFPPKPKCSAANTGSLKCVTG